MLSPFLIGCKPCAMNMQLSSTITHRAKVVGCKLLFKNKYNGNGSFQKHIVKPSTIHIVLSYVVSSA